MNKYGFFESFQSEIASNGKVSININLESDDHVIFRAASAAEGRYVISRFVLWEPKMTFNYKCENLFLKRYLKKHIWPCLKERIEIGVTTRQQIPVLSMTYLTRLTIDIDLFQNSFGVLYFDLRNQKEVGLYET